MRIAVVNDLHFGVDADGRVATESNFPYSYWHGFLDVFEEVTVIARVSSQLRARLPLEGPGVRVVRLPSVRGARAIARALPGIVGQIGGAVRRADVVLVRSPGAIASLVWLAARSLGRPHAVQVCGDPAESLREIAGGAFAPIATAHLRRQVRGAIASTYVTRETLQRRYPPPPGRFTVAVSEVDLPDDAFVAPVPDTSPGPVQRLVFAAALHRAYKGLDWLLAALALTRHRHTLIVAGDGPLRGTLEATTRRLGLADRVTFLGMLAGPAAVRARMRGADLFVLPSRTEGMPRVLLEAMAVGLPCVATPVGGVPELLPSSFLVAVDRPDRLAARIDDLAEDPLARAAAARANRAAAAGYRASERDRRLRTFRDAIAQVVRARR
jgi:phosphatidyl-myo-inositol dimannoside synthase